MFSILKSFDWWYSKNVFSLRFRCLIPLDVTESSHWTQSLLVLYIVVWLHASFIIIPLERCLRYWSYVVHSWVAIISSFQKMRAVWFWLIDFHAMGLLERKIRKPGSEWNMKISRGVPSSAALTYWLPQQEL